ncbi:hypothetical protein NPX13_g5899 [Xylaria arbuscula]|uniref:N-acetyltransferase domain-containing protein n=1 Tax=Xylaria arbuscula TaxID=114810 RepID=A0A9W8TLY7_9PEZI|nr:hypothetical protein NPX13_g5899 [Xylaria arbuscula]
MRAVYRVSGYPVEGIENALEVLQGDDQAWVAEDNDNGDAVVIGHVAMNRALETYVNVARWRELHPREADVDIAVLGRLFVHPGKQGRGIATKLIRAVEEEARRKGKRLLILALVKDQAAIRLYRHLGWEYYATVVFRWGEGKEMDAECFVSPLS